MDQIVNTTENVLFRNWGCSLTIKGLGFTSKDLLEVDAYWKRGSQSRNIGYIALFNQISSLWRSSKSFNLMDIENGYFLAKFQSIEDYNKVLVIYGQYLTVQPWTKYFNPMKPYPSMVLAWIRLLGLSGFMYKRRILEVVGGFVGNMVKLDLNTDKKTRGFARMSIMVEEVNGNKDLAELTTAGWGFAFRPWMVVKRKARVIRGKRFKENLNWGRDFRC
ncbi:hypothetical protein PVK06_027736 [Gossypium arboreum]|uniref:DUF4283 domain-containing protein n=1 Tax=Gossypium arboreum TaxID=29729 RepID=A0ABR0P3P6_GOSAR|nr:hypothetical protein PVK06_027736 [Gossypium arboreum]